MSSDHAGSVSPATLGEQQLRLALDAAKAGVWDWDVATDRVTWSDRLFEFHAIAKEDFRGRAGDFLTLVHPEDRDAVSGAIGKALEGTREYSVTFRTIRPSGEVRVLSTSAQLLRAADGTPQRMIGVTFDITSERAAADEQARLLAATQAARAAAEEANQVRERLLSIIGHDLKTPLSAIIFAAAGLRRLGLPEKGMDLIGRLSQSARRMSRMIDEMLDFAAARQAGGLRVAPQPTRLDELCHRAVVEVETAFPGTKIEANAEALPVVWDPDRVLQVLVNLLSNAVHHGNRGAITLSAAAADQKGHVHIAIHNTGPSIPDDVKSALFEPFARAAPGKGGGHLGLGLYICSVIVRAHGGTVEVRSPDKDGTTFVVTLPEMAR